MVISKASRKLSLAVFSGLLAFLVFADSLAQGAPDDEALSKAREALIFLQGVGVDIDTERGEALLIESAELDFGPAQLTLGEAYLFGNLGLEQNDENAWEWLDRALEHNLPLAKYYIGQLYYQGHAAPENKPRAFQLTLEAAEEGVTVAYRTLGYLYWDGDGTAKNDEQAIKWFAKAAEIGDIDAIVRLAVIYLHGADSVNPDLVYAFSYLTQGADLGDAWAQLNLGLLYMEGKGVKQDKKRAIELLSSSANAGEPWAMYELGRVLLTTTDQSIGDVDFGAYWLNEARKDEGTGKFAAQVLAESYEDGIGIGPDYSRAIELYLEPEHPVFFPFSA